MVIIVVAVLIENMACRISCYVGVLGSNNEVGGLATGDYIDC